MLAEKFSLPHLIDSNEETEDVNPADAGKVLEVVVRFALF
jgi:hypothetical protein